jgi:hypothetical protein
VRSKLVGGLLIASVLTWGIWCGGQLYLSLMTLPLWNSAAAFQAYFQLPRSGRINFFMLFGPTVVALGIGAPLIAWKSSARSRRWQLGSLVCAVAVAMLLFFTAPSIGNLIDQGEAGTRAPAELMAAVERWKLIKNARLLFELGGFLSAVMALRLWASE